MKEANRRPAPAVHRQKKGPLAGDILKVIGRFLRGQFLISLIMTVIYGVGFYWIGIPLWWLAAFLCGLCHWIPILGVALAAIVPLLLLLITGGTFGQIIWTLLLILGVQLLESFYLTPKVLGTELRLHPLLVLGGMIIGALIFGPVGAILAAPVLAVVLLIIRRLG